jgi:hypothetical protein
LKVACYVHPIVHTAGPCFNGDWNETLAKILRSLQDDARCECLLITGRWFTSPTGVPTVRLDELLLYRQLKAVCELPTALANETYQDEAENHLALDVIAEQVADQLEQVADRLKGFVPDIIIGFGGDANCLAKLWPKALRLHVDCGPYSRRPFPKSFFFDHLGMHAMSIMGRAGRRLLANPISPDGQALVGAFRSVMAAELKTNDPFRDHEFRGQFRHLCLLPLQVSQQFSFDGKVAYRSQFEFLHDFLCAAPPDVGVIITEHPHAAPVLKRAGPYRNMEYLSQKFPNMIFLDEFRLCSTSSQFLVPKVDGVWSVSSSVGYQALLFGRALGSPTKAPLASVADVATFAAFFDRLGHNDGYRADGLIAWQLERYLVPETFLIDGHWLCDYLGRRLNMARSAADPIDAFVPIGETELLKNAWAKEARKPKAAPYLWPVDDLNPLESTRAELLALVRERDSLLGSTSWRITAPFRAVTVALRTWSAQIKRFHEKFLRGKMRLGPRGYSANDRLARSGFRQPIRERGHTVGRNSRN